MRFIPVTSPNGTDLGWISTELVVSISPGGRYFKFKDGDCVVNGVVPYGMPDDLVLMACGIRPASVDTHAERHDPVEGHGPNDG